MRVADDSLPFRFGELPNELLLQIAGCLTALRGFIFASPARERLREEDNDSRRRALHALSLTCRRLHAITTPFLYGSVIQRAVIADPHTAPLFLRTVLQKPLLIKHVQYVELRLSSAGTTRASQPLGNDARRALEDIATLIALAGNFTELAFDKGDDDALRLPEKSDIPPSVRRVWYSDSPGEGSFDFMVAAGPLTNDTSLSEMFHGFDCECGPHAMPIDELYLDNFNKCVENIESIFTLCTSLRQFVCRWGTEISRDNMALWIDFPALCGGLHRFKDTLEYLVLDTLELPWQDSLEFSISAIGSLRDFSVLKHIDISGLILWGDNISDAGLPRLASILPESLESLIISMEWDGAVEDALQSLAEDSTSMLSKLRTVECPWKAAPTDVAERLTEKFKSAGVELTLRTAVSA